MIVFALINIMKNSKDASKISATKIWYKVMEDLNLENYKKIISITEDKRKFEGKNFTSYINNLGTLIFEIAVSYF